MWVISNTQKTPRQQLKPLFLFLILCCLNPLLYAGKITSRFAFTPNEITFKKIGEFDLPIRQDWIYPSEIGKPLIPYTIFQVLVPPTASVTEVKVISYKKLEIPNEYYIYPCQPPRPISSKEETPFVPPDEAIYNQDQEYPAQLVDFTPTGTKSGYRLCGINLYPLHYRPKARKLILYTDIVLEIFYEENKVPPQALTESQKKLFGAEVKSLIINKNDLVRFAPSTKYLDQANEIDYLIITSEGLATNFLSLADWKTKKGWNTKIRNTNWINSNYSGRDSPEKIRNYIRTCFADSGLKFVLLAGDNAIVPKRGVYGNVPTSPPTIDSFIPCDLYYADLEWSWDGDNDNVFGEPTVDTVDLYYDLFIGRASVDNTTEIANFLNKLFTYEKNPDPSYLKRILLPWGVLWSGYNSKQSQDSIASLTPAGWTDRYINDTRVTTEVRDSLNNGFQFCHLVGHGNEVGVYWTSTGPVMYGTTHPPTQTNVNKYLIANSIACYPGAFDYSDCLAEVMTNTQNCAVAVIMNSRYGWGTPPSIGPSELLDVRFYHYLFDTTYRIGMNHARSKEFYRNWALSYGVWRWCYYELNLFGCPEMPMWRAVPLSLSLAFEDTINVGNQNFTVTVTDPSFDAPVANALVCIWKGSEVYKRGYTNASGSITFTINPTTPGSMFVTASAFNHLPKEDTCVVVAENGDVGVTEIITPKGIIDSSATLIPRAVVFNFGSTPATFDVIFRILAPANYVDTVNVTNLPANTSDTIDFAPWIIGVRGTYYTQCTTAFVNDTNPTNDVISDSFQIVVKDVGVISINTPFGNIDSTQVPSLQPQAIIHNYGSDTVSFPVIFKIFEGVNLVWIDTQQVNALSPGADTSITFDFIGIGLPRGNYNTKCSTAYTFDLNRNNDFQTSSFSIIVHDIGVTDIVSPTGFVPLNTSITPQVEVKNYGSETDTFDVILTIGATYNDTVKDVILNSLSDTIVSFTNWTASPVGTYLVHCTTVLSGDLVPINDTLSDSVTVYDNDVGILAILTPVGNIDSTATIVPRCSLHNYGTSSATFDVTFLISGLFSYTNTQTVTNLSPGTDSVITFLPWTVGPRGTYIARCSLALVPDTNTSNDTMSAQFSILVHDVEVSEILAPKGVVPLNQGVTPQAVVRNNGTQAESFNVGMIVLTPSPSSWSCPITLNAGATDTVDFLPAWTATPLGTHQVRCSTDLANDMILSNNLKVDSVIVSAADVGVTEIIYPVGTIDSTASLIPRAVVFNYGSTAASFPVILRITGATSYVDTQSVINLPSNTADTINFTAWAIGPRGFYTVQCSTAFNIDTSVINDTLSGQFEVIVHDAGVTTIIAPTGIVSLNTTIVPRARVRNYGTETETFDVIMKIGALYSDTSSITLNPNSEDSVYFNPWLATPVGTYLVSCSTALSGDLIVTNDTLSDSVLVVAFDVGVNAILAPVGTIDSSTTPTVTPQASVTNYASVPVTFPAIFRIYQGAYVWADTQPNVSLNAGQTLTISFNPWTVNGTGVYHTRCTTGLVGDINPNNDYKDSVFRVVAPCGDVGVTLLTLTPPGPFVDSGTTVAISATIHNFGTEVVDCPVVTKISTFYADTEYVVGLVPNADTILNFANWLAVERGTHTIRCTTELEGDIDPTNDRQIRVITVLVRDVRTYSILSPIGNIDSTANPITPQARVQNSGNILVDSFKVIFTITGPVNFTDTQIVRNLPAGQQQSIDFNQWTIGPVGAYTTACSTAYPLDMNPSNDRGTSQFWIQRCDISVDSIISPLGTVDSGTKVVPKAWVSNQGTAHKNFLAVFRIGTFYTDTVNLTLNSLAETLAIFDTWHILQPEGTYLVQCTSIIANDINPANNSDTGFVRIRVKDIGIDSILSPTPIVPPGTMTPIVRITNFGGDIVNFYAYFLIRSASGTVYFDSAYITNLMPDSSLIVTFLDWNATTGSYTARCSLALLGDMIQANDTLSLTFYVATHDVGVKRIIYPGRRTLIGPIQPRIIVKNYSIIQESFWVRFSIIDTTNNTTVYFDSVYVSGLAPWLERIVDFSVWTADVGNYSLTSYTLLIGDANPTNDTAFAYCRVDSILLPRWSQKTNMPSGPRNRKVKLGGSLCFGGDNLYAFKGSNTNEFYAYSINADTWITKDTIPYAPDKKKKVKGGAVLCYDRSNTIFALKGANTLEFWAYSIPYNTWVQLPDVPYGNRRIKGGSGLVYVPTIYGDFIYCLKGSKTFEFYAYSITGNFWLPRRNAPSGFRGKPMDYGSCLTYDPQTNKIYALKGSENEFFAYDIEADSWYLLASLPIFGFSGQKRAKHGAALAADGSGLIYAFKGNNTQEFWVYHTDSDWWEQLDPIPLGPEYRKVKQGGALTFAPSNGKIYALKGNRTLELWLFDPSALEFQSHPGTIHQSTDGIGEETTRPLDIVRFKIAPNPNKGVFTLKIYSPNSQLAQFRVRIYNALGEKVYSNSLTGSASLPIAITNLASGVYILKIEYNGSKTSTKILIQK